MFRRLCLIPALALLLAADEPKPDAAEISRLVRQLGSEKFETRDAASKRLEAIGAAALGALREAASSSDDAEVKQRAGRLVKVITRRIHAARRVFTGHDDQATYALFSPDGRRVLSSSDDRSVRLWDVATGKEIRRFEG